MPVSLSPRSISSANLTSDIPQMAKLYLEQFSENQETPILVADSARYSADNLQLLSEVKWNTRVPVILSEAKTLVAAMRQ